MRHFFNLALVIQLALIFCFLLLGWQADQAMDKSGVGNLAEWQRYNSFAGMVFFSIASVWVIVVSFAAFKRVFELVNAQISIGLPPLVLVLWWGAMWLL
ncbi:hypothetical protein [Shewanella zhangzhouensis]|uniref:hypothetical protein n=1 Tax=Shewanella zhangzhouensis TaxID=2864213 RepID=UPI001C65DEED|nr:hypothetical protein [Shewanella zhangzhouensis]QYK06873.1 hypothetical protein K0H63_08785 [Shewanella zhangzhouensis]